MGLFSKATKVPSPLHVIYTDQEMLNSYATQFGAPVVFDKVSTYAAELTIATPKASATQSRFGRAPTLTEQLGILWKKFEKERMLTQFPIGNRVDVADFGVVTMTARRAVFGMKSEGNEVAVWMSVASNDESEKDLGRVYILENRGRTDVQGYEVVDSAYSALRHLMTIVRPKLVVPNQPEPRMGGPEIDDVFEQNMGRYRDKPDDLCRLMGAKVGGIQRIWSLFATRYGGRDLDIAGGFPMTIFGYPLVIARAPRSGRGI